MAGTPLPLSLLRRGWPALLLLLTACAAPLTPSPTPASSPTPAAVSVPHQPLPLAPAFPTPPERDLVDLAVRFRLGGREPPPLSFPRFTQADLGRVETFWAVDLEAKQPYQVTAVLRWVSPHAAWYVEEGAEVALEALKEAARTFEEWVYPRLLSLLVPPEARKRVEGLQWTVLHARLGGAAGYFGSPDFFPRSVHRYSNQRPMVYLSRNLPLGHPLYQAVLAHEMAHAFHYFADRTEETWVSEGLAETATESLGFRPSLWRVFLQRPTASLTEWPEEPSQTPPHYGAAHLFLRWVVRKGGGPEAVLPLLAGEPRDGREGVEAVVARRGLDASFEDLFLEWAVALALGRAGEDLGGRVPSRPVALPGEVSGSLSPFSFRALALRLEPGDYRLTFQGQEEVPLLPVDPPSGSACWWTGRGDDRDSRLTRRVDLRGVGQATLEFSVWYETEEEWDYLYVAVSTDGGKTWQALRAPHMSTRDPVGNAYGPGYTGRSEGWVRERIDLTPFAGREVLLRFEYVTDDSLNLSGACIDDIAIPQVGFRDDAEEDRGWVAEGFVRTGLRLPQRWGVRVVEVPEAGEPRAFDLPLDGGNRGEVVLRGLGRRFSHALVVVASLTPWTRQKASYRLTISPLEGP